MRCPDIIPSSSARARGLGAPDLRADGQGGVLRLDERHSHPVWRGAQPQLRPQPGLHLMHKAPRAGRLVAVHAAIAVLQFRPEHAHIYEPVAVAGGGWVRFQINGCMR